MNTALSWTAYGRMIQDLQNVGQMSSAASTASYGYDERDPIVWNGRDRTSTAKNIGRRHVCLPNVTRSTGKHRRLDRLFVTEFFQPRLCQQKHYKRIDDSATDSGESVSYSSTDDFNGGETTDT
jgi:hypothetical protein